MGDLEKQVERFVKEEEGEEEEKLIEGMAMLDFDMLCASVALQTHGKWSKLQTHQDEGEFDQYNDVGGGGGAFRMWEGEILDCLHDRRVAAQSLCCPGYRFGRNMRRAGFGSCFLQGIVLYVLAISALANFLAFVLTKRHCFVYLGIGFTLSVGMYLGFFRTRIRKKFNIRGSDSFLDDCVHHLFCPCCTLSQVAIVKEAKDSWNCVHLLLSQLTPQRLAACIKVQAFVMKLEYKIDHFHPLF